LTRDGLLLLGTFLFMVAAFALLASEVLF